MPAAASRTRHAAAQTQELGAEYRLARAAAEHLLDQHWTGELPVDVKKIARAVGLHISSGHFAHEGRLVGDDVIEVPGDESRAAQRFAIGHEIGHRQLRHKVHEEKIEAEANAFAAELLVPRQRLNRAVGTGMRFDELRRYFDVSREALTYALMDASLLHVVQH